MAERWESDAHRDSENAVRNESQQVPGHRVIAQRRASEQSANQEKVYVESERIDDSSAENPDGKMAQVARGGGSWRSNRSLSA